MKFVSCYPWMLHPDTSYDYSDFYGVGNMCPTCQSNNTGIINGPFPLTIKESCTPKDIIYHEETENFHVTDDVLAAIGDERLDVDVIPATVKGKKARPRHVIIGRVTTKRWFTEEDLTARYLDDESQEWPLHHTCETCNRTAYLINTVPVHMINQENLQGFGDFVASPEQFFVYRSTRRHMYSERLYELLRRFDKRIKTYDEV